MYVHSASAFICNPVDDLAVLKEDLKNYTDFFFRRVNKFILLSLMGVHRCVHNKSIDKSSSVYLATENGNLGDTENVLHQLYKENSFPKPFNFINTMSNTASFYVAQSLKSLGRSITVSRKNVSFERGLELAMVDFGLGYVREALVGGVDEAVNSREHFEKKYDASYHSAKLVEGSSWVYLSTEKAGALGEITDVKTFHTKNEAIQWARGATETPAVMSFGVLMTPQEKDNWKKECSPSEEFDYIGGYGFYDTAAAFAISKFFETYNETALIHVNRNIQGQYVIISCKRLAPRL